MNKDPKCKYWGFVGYEESLPSDYIDILNLTGLPWARSPYHDSDLNADGEKKKPHYHFIICWPAPTTFNAVSRLVCDTLHQPIPIPLISPKGYYRYFTHKDNPEKYQYSESEITTYSGFDISQYFNSEEVDKIMMEISAIIRDLSFIEYSQVYYYLLDNMPRQYVTVFQTHTIHFNALLRSLRYGGVTTTAPIGDE